MTATAPRPHPGLRHLDTATAVCPLDGGAVRRAVCGHCPHFVSFRAVEVPGGGFVERIGCAHGSDVARWLRGEFAAIDAAIQTEGAAARTVAARRTRSRLTVGFLALGAAAVLFGTRRRSRR